MTHPHGEQSTNALVMAWRSNPNGGGPQLTHAAQPPTRRALCGSEVTFFGERWPSDPDQWPVHRSRCQMCAHSVHITPRP